MPPGMPKAEPAGGWLRLAIGSGAAMLLAMGLGRFSYTAMVPALIERGWLGAAEAGYAGGCNFAGFLLGALATEWLRRRIALALLLRAAVLIAALALFASAVDAGFWWLALWRGLLGICVAVVMVLGLALTTAATPDGHRATGTAVIFAGVGLGIFFSGTLVPWLLDYGVAAAWSGIAVAGGAAVIVALWGWRDAAAIAFPAPKAALETPAQPFWAMLLLSHACFSVALVPHVLYWVDFIARGQGHGIAIGGLHWSVAGFFAFIGPVLALLLARRIGTAWALVAVFIALAFGIAAPGFDGAMGVLIASTVIFGTQPGLSALIAARARDLGSAAAMPRLMRQMILINAVGAGIAGMAFPALYQATGRTDTLFLIAGAIMATGAVLAAPWQAILAKKA
jgi:MFS family permease